MYGTPWSGSVLAFAQRCADDIATLAGADATTIVGYLQANAVAHVTTQQLGAMPSSTSEGTPIEAPASPVDIPIQ